MKKKETSCCFFGHRDTPNSIRPKLKLEILKLILDEGVSNFYVGTNGNFDIMVYQVLKEIKTVYPDIEYTVVLAYESDARRYFNDENIYLPEVVKNAPSKAAIPRRNNWMIENSNFVISYITKSYGGAAKFTEIASTNNLIMINIG